MRFSEKALTLKRVGFCANRFRRRDVDAHVPALIGNLEDTIILLAHRLEILIRQIAALLVTTRSIKPGGERREYGASAHRARTYNDSPTI